MADNNPFIAYRHHLDVYRLAIARGLSDDAFVELVRRADESVAEVNGGTGFLITPLQILNVDDGGGNPDPVAAKVETANVSGSHKARHLFGLLLHNMIVEATSGRQPDEAPELERGARPPALAIASCGNAALGAAVVARAAGRRLRVFVPVDADPNVLERLAQLEAETEICHRQPGTEGDPCVIALHDAIADGDEPFTVQGPICPDVIDGGRTIGLELADQLDASGLAPTSIFIQIGGGALASAVMDGLARRWEGRRLPRLHPVQATNAHPYVAGWRRIAPRLLEHLGAPDPGSDAERAEILAAAIEPLDLPPLLDSEAHLMTPWPDTPHSVASGILDDVTYDWRTLMAHQIASGGWPILVDEETFRVARTIAGRQVEPPPDETGAAGLAGYLTFRALNPHEPSGEAVVLITGAAR